jgi:hypothetical protein
VICFGGGNGILKVVKWEVGRLYRQIAKEV